MAVVGFVSHSPTPNNHKCYELSVLLEKEEKTSFPPPYNNM